MKAIFFQNRTINYQKLLIFVYLLGFKYPVGIVLFCVTCLLIVNPLDSLITQFYEYFQNLFYLATPGHARLVFCADQINVKEHIEQLIQCTNLKIEEVPIAHIILASKQFLISVYCLLVVLSVPLYFFWPQCVKAVSNRLKLNKDMN